MCGVCMFYLTLPNFILQFQNIQQKNDLLMLNSFGETELGRNSYLMEAQIGSSYKESRLQKHFCTVH